MPSRRAVFTGLGLHTPIGNDPAAFWQSLVAGVAGVRKIQRLDASGLRCRIAGEILDYDPRKAIPATMKEARKAVGRLARTVQLGVTAAQQVMNESGPAPGSIDPFRFGVEFACVMVATELDDLAGGAVISAEGLPPGEISYAKWGGPGLDRVPPLWMLKYLPNMPASHASINADAQGPNNTHTSTEVAGLNALGEAYRILQRDGADYFLVGGCESKLNPLSVSRYDLFGEYASKYNEDPEHAVRPYDAGRCGTVLGEGAAAFGLESLEHAQKRGVKVLAELTGFASAFDHGKTGEGIAYVIRRAMEEAKITPADLDHVNAAAGGWTDLDAWEARGIRSALGDIPVFALKGHLGNTGAASGLVELAATILALQHGELPGTRNHDQAASDCPVVVHTGAPRTVRRPYAVKLSFTDAGQCSAVVVRRAE